MYVCVCDVTDMEKDVCTLSHTEIVSQTKSIQTEDVLVTSMEIQYRSKVCLCVCVMCVRVCVCVCVCVCVMCNVCVCVCVCV